jgi:hypothetical protein
VQVGRRCLDVVAFALPGTRLRGQHTAAVDILEVTVRELVPGIALPRVLHRSTTVVV